MMVNLNTGTFSWNHMTIHYLHDYSIGKLFYNWLTVDLDKILACGWNRKDFLAAIAYYEVKSGSYELYLNDFKNNLEKYLTLVTIRDIIE